MVFDLFWTSLDCFSFCSIFLFYMYASFLFFPLFSFSPFFLINFLELFCFFFLQVFSFLYLCLARVALFSVSVYVFSLLSFLIFISMFGGCCLVLCVCLCVFFSF